MTGTLRTTMKIGVGMRGDVRRALKKYCFDNELELSLDEDKGWIISLFTVKIEGPKDRILVAKNDIERYFERIG